MPEACRSYNFTGCAGPGDLRAGTMADKDFFLVLSVVFSKGTV